MSSNDPRITQVAAPVLLDEVPLCIEKLQNKVNEYKEKQADVLKKVSALNAFSCRGALFGG